MQYGLKWKNRLNIEDSHLKKLPCSLIYNYDLVKDLDRTFPRQIFFNKNQDILKNIILNFIEVNSAMDYFQGLCYITYVLYYAFKDIKSPGCITFYALHRIVSPIRPIIPLDDHDEEPIKFINNLEKLILLNVFQKNNNLGKRLKDLHIIHIFIVSGLPALFANWYSLNETLLLWDHLIDSSGSIMLDKIIDFLTCFFLYHEKIIMHLNIENILSLLQQRQGLSNIILMLKYKK